VGTSPEGTYTPTNDAPPGPTAAFEAPTPDPPSTPSSDTGTPLYHHNASGTHKIRGTAPSPFPDGVDAFLFRVYDVDGTTLLYESAELGVAETAEYGPIHQGYVSWVARNAGGDAESDKQGFLLAKYDGLWRGDPDNAGTYLTDGYLPDAAPSDAVETFVSETQHDLIQILISGFGAGIEQLKVGINYPIVDSFGAFKDDLRTVYEDAAYSIERLVWPGVNEPTVRCALVNFNGHGGLLGPVSTLLFAGATSAPPPPVVTIISATAADIAAIAFAGDWDSAQLEYGRVGYGTSLVSIVESTIQHLTGLIANAAYQARFVATGPNGTVNGPWTPFTPSTAGSGGDGGGGAGRPTSPGEITLTRLTDTTARIEMPALPGDADALRLIFSSGTFIADLAGNASYVISGLTAETDYSVRARAVNVFGTADGPDLLFTTESEAEQSVDGAAPDTPDAPTATKMCSLGGINISAPAWAESPEIVTMELRRRVDSGSGFGAWSTVETWEEGGGSYFDSDVEPFAVYEYAVRALNAAGESAWSTAASVTLQSSKLTVSWQLPTALAEIAGRQLLRVQLVDTGETLDACGGVNGGGPCALQSPNVQLYIGDTLTPATFTKASGSVRNGIYECLFDTRDYSNGDKTLRLTAKGSDCCFAKAEQAVTFDNVLRSGTLYFQEQYQSAPPTGQQYGKASILMQNEALYDHAARRYWVRMALATDADDLVDWASLVLTPTEKAAAFDLLQLFSIEPLQSGTTPTRTQIGATAPLLKPGQELYLVQQWNPVEVLTTYLTDMNVGAVRSIRRFSNGVFHVFASKDDGSAAKLFSFDYDAGLTELLDLSEHNAGDALDCIRVNDKYFVVRPDEVFTVDADPNEIEMPSDPRGETRSGRFVLRVPAADIQGESDVSVGLYVDEALEAAQTAAYDLTYKSPKLLWTLDEVLAFAEYRNETLMLACGTKLYSSDDITNVPTLNHTFGAEITSLGLSDETWLVGLADNHIWALVDNAWIDRGALSTPALALSGWEGSGETFYDVAGGDSPQLFERVLAGGLWSDLRTIEADEADVTQITALARYEKITREESGTPGEPGYQPQEAIIGLLIGSAPDGALLLLELSPLASANALLASKMSHFAVEGFEVPVV
jgi:hypothetical protein